KAPRGKLEPRGEADGSPMSPAGRSALEGRAYGPRQIEWGRPQDRDTPGGAQLQEIAHAARTAQASPLFLICLPSGSPRPQIGRARHQSGMRIQATTRVSLSAR